jgi:predicted nuclease with TOPRIM domain
MGGRGKHRTYPDENTDKTKALRQRIKELETENKRLKSELKTLNKAFEKTASYIKGNTDGVSVEKMIAGAKAERTMIEIKSENVCPDCSAEIKTTRLPFGKLSICTAACGWREVENESN